MSWNLRRKIKHVLSQEEGTIYKSGAEISVALVFPNTYYVGMSSLGFQTVYGLLNRRRDTVAERVFLPEKEDWTEYVRTRTPLFSWESFRPLYEFDIVAFSISYELDYLQVLRILEAGRIPLFSNERDETHPLIMVGGPVTFFNPEPLAEFVDCFVLGEAEEVISEIFDLYYQQRESGVRSREEILKVLSKIEGVYVPRGYEVNYDNTSGRIIQIIPQDGWPPKIRRRWVKDLNSWETCSVILTSRTEFGRTFLVEVSRGCARRCRFCVAGFGYSPFRIRSSSRILQLIEDKVSEENRVGLVGAAVSDHPEISFLSEELKRKKIKLSVSSLRIDSLSESLVDALAAGGARSITLAPEVGTPRLRKIIHKEMTDEEILKAVKLAVEKGISRLKLYFMIGLPREEETDLQGIIQLVEKIKETVFYTTRHKVGITLSINPFIPKPQTPFQWETMVPAKELGEKILYLRKTLLPGGNLRILSEDLHQSLIQAAFARGDRRLSGVLLEMHKGTSWKESWRNLDLKPEFYLSREYSREEILPWEHLELGPAKDLLWKERSQAYQQVE